MGTLHVSCAAEGAYVIHSAALLDSVLAHRGALDVHVHYLHGPRMPARSSELLRQMVEGRDARISFLAVGDELVADLPSDPQFTAAMWHRSFLPELLPDVDRVLYLDVDTVVMDALEPLWATDVSGHYLAAVTNVLEPRFRHRPSELGLSGPAAYFNSGVLLLNLERMRADDRGAAVRAFARDQGPRLMWPDQDSLNVLLGGQRVPLHPRWNVMNSLMGLPATDEFSPDQAQAARSRPGIRHFEGPGVNKPWHYLCAQPHRQVYDQHRLNTPWPRVRRQGVTPLNVVRRLTGAARRPPRLNP